MDDVSTGRDFARLRCRGISRASLVTSATEAGSGLGGRAGGLTNAPRRAKMRSSEGFGRLPYFFHRSLPVFFLVLFFAPDVAVLWKPPNWPLDGSWSSRRQSALVSRGLCPWDVRTWSRMARRMVPLQASFACLLRSPLCLAGASESHNSEMYSNFRALTAVQAMWLRKIDFSFAGTSELCPPPPPPNPGLPARLPTLRSALPPLFSPPLAPLLSPLFCPLFPALFSLQSTLSSCLRFAAHSSLRRSLRSFLNFPPYCSALQNLCTSRVLCALFLEIAFCPEDAGLFRRFGCCSFFSRSSSPLLSTPKSKPT